MPVDSIFHFEQADLAGNAQLMRPMLISPVNFSEGTRIESVKEIAGAASQFCHLLDVHMDRDHNRSVVTLAGYGTPLVDGIISAARAASGLIDLRTHFGVHPRMGAIDVVPFVPSQSRRLSEEAAEEAVAASVSCARRFWEELRIPSFLYELSALDDRGIPLELPALRKEAFGRLEPLFGHAKPHPTAGAVAVGARPMLVAFNVNLDTTDVTVARNIATALRRRLPHVRALGLPMISRGLVQVSCNLTSPEQTTMSDVFAAVTDMARDHSVAVLESEVAGLVPRQALGGVSPSSLQFSLEPKLLEDCLDRIS